MPFDGTYPLTQKFNDSRYRASYTKFGLLGHNGLDYGLSTGTTLLAPHKGKIVEATFDSTGYGYYYKIENEEEGSILAHLQDLPLKVGTVLSEGEFVGKSDNTGNSTGPHLHWGYYRIPRNRDNGFNGYIDQTDWLNVKPFVINDQTILPIIDENGNQMEVQAVRSRLQDWGGQITNLKLTVTSLNTKITQLEEEVENQPSSTTDPSLNALRSVISSKWTWIGITNSWKLRLSQLRALLP